MKQGAVGMAVVDPVVNRGFSEGVGVSEIIFKKKNTED